MAKREKRALAAFLQGAGSTYLQGMQQRNEEQRRAREEWKKCLFEGEKTPDECLILSGYQPEEDEMLTAMSAREKGIEVREAPKKREEAVLGQFLEAKRTGKMPEIGEMSPEAFKVYGKHEKVFGEERREQKEQARLGEKRTYEKKEKLFWKRWDFKTQKELAKYKAGLKDTGQSDVEKNLDYLKKKYTSLRTATEVEKIKWKDLGLDVETMTWRQFLESLSDVWSKEIEFELGRIGGGNQQEIYNKCRAEGGTPEECKIKAGI